MPDLIACNQPKGLLTASNLTLTEVALAAGYASIRRFNAEFKSSYNSSPSELRKKGTAQKSTAACQNQITIHLSFRPPFNWEAFQTYFQGRAASTVEHASLEKYQRSIRLPCATSNKVLSSLLTITCDEEKRRLSVSFSKDLIHHTALICEKVRSLYGP